MKKYLFSLMNILMLFGNVHAQNPNMVYSSIKTPVSIDLPSVRKAYGGTIIDAVYSGSGFSTQIKGAFEYACKLVEESMPTTCPIKVKVEFSSSLSTGVLAMVQANQANEGMCGMNVTVDKIYAKRFIQVYGKDSYSDDNAAFEFYKESEDAVIKFSTKVKFNYSIETDNLSPNEYDFITVATQALIKAMGFTCKAYNVNNQLNISTPANKFTYSLLSNDPTVNYQIATSNNTYIRPEYGSTSWLLECESPYKQGISLNYFAESDNTETAIMQYGISKGSYIRYIGKSINDFFSFCGWDRPIVTGIGGGYNIETANTNNVINYQGINSTYSKQRIISRTTQYDNFNVYLDSISEVGKEGDFVLLKNGTWRQFSDLKDLTDNDNYARTADGYLRLKTVSKSWGPGHQYYNWHVTYKLYDYIPQKPIAAIQNYSISPNALLNNRRDFTKTIIDDVFLDVEIGYKNIEGTDHILVEQIDADYPIPYTYMIDNPHSGSFIAYMNQKYPSTFKLTYINSNGQTTGDSFTIDLTSTESINLEKVNIETNKDFIKYSVDTTNNKNIELNYNISDIKNGNIILNGHIVQTIGTIDISSLPHGIYLLKIYNKKGRNIHELKLII